jgi:hypothetical protein
MMKHDNYMRAILLAACVSAASLTAYSQQQSAPARQKPGCPMHKKHMAEAQDRHMHGGAIEVGVSDPRDEESRGRVRSHLEQISKMFSIGDFSTPFAVHARTPPGVAELERLKSTITYRYEETESGGRVRISSGDAKALAAIHDFLRFQIEDHRTGDPVDVIK